MKDKFGDLFQDGFEIIKSNKELLFDRDTEEFMVLLKHVGFENE